MKLKLFTFLIFAASLLSSQAAPLDLASLRFGDDYKTDSYIRAAADLQAMGREAACQTLLEFTRTNNNEMGMPVIALCRMLFTQRGTNEFRPAKIGFTMGPGSSTDWTLYPIEIVDGIPFKVLSGGGGMNGGGPEGSSSYLSYCMTNCDWNNFRFHEPTADEKKDALHKLISSNKWKRPLVDYELDFFSKQIE